jgi:hypothetical protein
VTLAAVDNDLTSAQRQAAARDAYWASVEARHPLTGADLGRQFGRTARWGRMQISKFRAERNGHDDSPDHRNGTERPISREPDRTDRDPPPVIREAAAAGAHLEALERRLNGHRPSRGHGEVPRRPWLDTAITLIVALVAAAASYGHMLDVALLAGEPLWIARAFPITVDGLVLAALRRGEDGRRWLALGAAVSVAANVLAQFPEQAAAAGPVVSAWPPLALYGTHRLLQGRQRPTSMTGGEVTH